jgi:hypothetical protein
LAIANLHGAVDVFRPVCNAKVTYARFRELFDAERFQTMRRHGA